MKAYSTLFLLVLLFNIQTSLNGQQVSTHEDYWTNYFDRSLGIGVSGYAYAIYQNEETTNN